MNITQNVYDHLKDSAEKIGKTVEERDTMNDLIKSGRFTQQALRDELYPKRDSLNREIDGAKREAIDAARKMIAEYREENQRAQRLDPAELTDDVKLMQPGIKLLRRDIEAILERNANNRTMTQLALRYAKDNGIDMGGTMYTGGSVEEATAQKLENVLFYFEKYLGRKDAIQMLDRFMNC